MKSYILGIVIVMILSAAYALSNTAEITIKFLNLQATFPQGYWEVIIFGLGVLIMWLISVCESVETYVKNRKKTKELIKRIAQLEDERKSLFDTLRSFGWKDRDEDETQVSPEPNPRHECRSDTKTDSDLGFHREPGPPRESEAKAVSDNPALSDGVESQKNAEVKPPFLKTFISSVFKREKNVEARHEASEVIRSETNAQTAGPENVCSIPEFESEPAEEKYGAQAVTETEEKEKSEI